MTRRPIVLTTLIVGAATIAGPMALAHNEGLPSVPVSINKMTHVNNVPNSSGNSIDFFERRLADGTTKWYVVVATQGNGFDIVDITNPDHPVVAGRYLLPPTDRPADGPAGVNYHAWVSVNPRRNIVALTIEDPAGRAVRHSGSVGMQFVDISDVANPKPLGKVNGLDGPHTVRMIGDNHAYTSLNTYIVDYTNPMSPTSQRANHIEGHEFYEDPNIPGRGYMGFATQVGKWGIMDLTDPAAPSTPIQKSEIGLMNAHEVYPAPDSSYVGVAEFRAGLTETECPGGAVWFYDISGKYRSGASLTNPVLMGRWYAPFTGVGTTVQAPNGPTNYAPCTMHSWQMQPERQLALGGLYAGGTWVFDPSQATKSGGDYVEFDGGARKTDWGNTLGNVRDAADFVNASQWLPFDTESPQAIANGWDRVVFTNGWFRGLDVYKYDGALPKKMARLRVNGQATGGAVTGTLDRYAVLTYEGWKNKPLAGEQVQVTAGGTTVAATTGADGSFSANLGLGAGSHQVTVTWAGNDRFEETTATRSVTG